MITRIPMKKTQLGSRDLLTNGGGCPVEVSDQHFAFGFPIELDLPLFERSFVVYAPQKKTAMSNNSQIIHHHVSKWQVQLNFFSIHPR